MKCLFLLSLAAAVFLPCALLLGQSPVPEIRFDAVDPLTYPASVQIGEVAGVATSSRGEIFVYTRTGHPVVTLGTSRTFSRGGSRMFQFDRSGKYMREIGQDLYGFLVAQQVRVDPQDNIWTVDQMSNTIVKFDTTGQVALLLGRKAEAERVPTAGAGPAAAGGGRGAAAAPGAAAGGGRGGRGAAAPEAGAGAGRRAGGGGGGSEEGGGRRGGGPPGSGQPQDLFIRPSDIAWDAAGNIYVADGLGSNSRVAKFDKTGKFVKSWGQTGTGPGQFNTVSGIAIDAQGNVYVADAGNKRIQVFDENGTFKSQIENIGAPSAICITPGAHQYLYASNSNPVDDIDIGGEIYKLELDGRVLGKFGRAGKLLKEFGTVNAIDCRTDNTLYVGEIGNWRVQKLTLHP